jgi:hypothetical protein
MKRINPLLTANNPAPIPGCHAPGRAIAHSAVVFLSHVFLLLRLALSLSQVLLLFKPEIKAPERGSATDVPLSQKCGYASGLEEGHR